MRSVHAAVAMVLLATAARAQEQGGPAAVGRVRGVVVDSLSGRPLAGAEIQLVSAGDPAASVFHASADSLGRFHLDSLPAGEYLAGFMDPLLDSLRLESPLRKVSVRAGGDSRVDLATPSAANLRRVYCGPSADSASFGVAVGVLRDAKTGDPVPGGHVIAEAPVVAVRDHALHWETLQANAATGADGGFLLCGVPTGRDADVLAVAGRDSSGVFSLELPAAGILVRDVFVGAADSDGTLTGRVLNAAGAPIHGARVLLQGTMRQAVADDSGRFALRGAPLGTRTLYTRAIGFLPDERVVDVVAGASRSLELRLPSMQSVLDTIHVYGRRVFHDRQEFERRRRMGFGQFLERAQIERQRAVRTTDLLRQLRGVFLTPTSTGLLLDVRGRLCLPGFALDGHPFQLMQSVDEIDSWVQPNEVQAMEVYIGTDAPVEYQRAGYPSCATIVIWTNPAFSLPVPQ